MHVNRQLSCKGMRNANCCKDPEVGSAYIQHNMILMLVAHEGSLVIVEVCLTLESCPTLKL